MKIQKSKAIGINWNWAVSASKAYMTLAPGLGVVANSEAVMKAVVENGRKANTEYQFAIDASLAATVALNVQLE